MPPRKRKQPVSAVSKETESQSNARSVNAANYAKSAVTRSKLKCMRKSEEDNSEDFEISSPDIKQMQLRKPNLAVKANRKTRTRKQKNENKNIKMESKTDCSEVPSSPVSKLKKLKDSLLKKDMQNMSTERGTAKNVKGSKIKRCKIAHECRSPYFLGVTDEMTQILSNSDKTNEAPSSPQKRNYSSRMRKEVYENQSIDNEKKMSNCDAVPSLKKKKTAKKNQTLLTKKVSKKMSGIISEVSENSTIAEPKRSKFFVAESVRGNKLQGTNSTSTRHVHKTKPEKNVMKLPAATNIVQSTESSESSDGSDSCWEDVEDLPSTSPRKKTVAVTSIQPLQITIENADVKKGKKKSKLEKIQEYMRREFNRFKKEVKENIHKVHLMCCVARGIYVRNLCKNAILSAQALSIIPSELTRKSFKKFDVSDVEMVVKWFRQTFQMCNNREDNETKAESTFTTDGMIETFQNRASSSIEEYICICIVVLSTLKADVRLVSSLQPISLKPPNNKNSKTSNIRKEDSGQKSKKTKTDKESSNNSKELSANATSNKLKTKNKLSRKRASKIKPEMNHSAGETDSDTVPVSNSERPDDDKTSGGRKLGSKKKHSQKCAAKVKETIDLSDDDSSSSNDALSMSKTNKTDCDKKLETRNKLSRVSKAKSIIDKSSDDSGLEDDGHKPSDSRGKKGGKRKSTKKLQKKTDMQTDSSSDCDFEVLSPRRPASSASRASQESSPSHGNAKNYNSASGLDHWIEVYLEAGKRWIYVNCVNGDIDKPETIEKYCTQPITYVVAFDNDNCLKDLTCHYASRWMSHTRKLRIDQEWWQETLKPYQTRKRKRDKEENEQMKAKLLQQPFPTSIAEFKSHPLYALKRHLLKFEALYPESAVPLGYIRGEPIYARECVHDLHTRETWLKEAKVIRVGEKPYKMVKRRLKPGKPVPDGVPMVDVYGKWQIEDYIPPIAVDGKVPRNEYGNVEMFKPCMLPVGTVHLQIPGLNKVARKLDMDCVPAMVGWDFHSGFVHAIHDGFIVCEEVKDTLLAAWEQEKQITEKKEAEKREKKVMQNWKLLIRGVLIKDRLQKRYDLQKNPLADSKATSGKSSDSNANNAELSWPRNRQSNMESETKHLFEFEKM